MAQDNKALHAQRRLRCPLSKLPTHAILGKRALALGGGGSARNAWEIVVIAGLYGAGVDVTAAGLVIGTSAGSTVAAQITSTPPPELLTAILAEAAPQTGPAGSDSGRLHGGSVATTWKE